MTEPSIEELEQQHRAATERLAKARTEASEIADRLRSARLAATGLSGHLVEVVGTYLGGTRFVVRTLGWDDQRVAGPMVKKDGKLSLRRVEMYIANVKDLGLYVEASR